MVLLSETDTTFWAHDFSMSNVGISVISVVLLAAYLIVLRSSNRLEGEASCSPPRNVMSECVVYTYSLFAGWLRVLGTFRQ
jgi:hypothetical protein